MEKVECTGVIKVERVRSVRGTSVEIEIQDDCRNNVCIVKMSLEDLGDMMTGTEADCNLEIYPQDVE